MHKYLRFLAWMVAIIAVVIGLGRLLLFVSWTVPEDDPWLANSLEPTLGPGDTVLVLVRGTPGFGDLVRCTDPDDPNGWVVGRIVGVAGDTVEVRGASLRVNNTRYDSTEACQKSQFTIEHPDTGAEITLNCARVDLGGTWHYRGSALEHTPADEKTITVEEGAVFLLSDNRSYHDDSRDYGTVDLASCKGRIVYRLWGREGWSDDTRRMDTIR